MEFTDILEKRNRAPNVLAGVRAKHFLKMLQYVPALYRLSLSAKQNCRLQEKPF